MRLVNADALKEIYSGNGTFTEAHFRTAIDEMPTASPWRRVEEKPKEGTWCVISNHSYFPPHNLYYDIAHYLHGTFSVYDSEVGDWFDGKPLYWMPIEPPKEDA
jgi:hypothetical protein